MAHRDEIAHLQYITTGATPAEIAREVASFLCGGGRWVQLRMKEAPDRAVTEAAEMLLTPIHACGGILLIDDRVEVAARVGADGVHLGRDDMPPAEARAIMGDAIIGATANTADHIMAAVEAGVDYIGLGPFRYTTTKKRLSPVLGAEGYREVLSSCGASIPPVVAIGGITPDDIETLAATGVWGVAVAGAIAHGADPVAATELFVKLTQKYFK
ncbi:MAG: thiamine phosphate synthase [Rikenellaceae bacterium]|nr:thiamine phosphate synthase [Rikenellaceae bacterium]